MLTLWTHALAALVFAALAASQANGAGRRSFAAALALTALWSLAVAGIGPGDAVTAVAEAARDLAWLGAMVAFVRVPARIGIGVGAVYVAVAGIATLAAALAVIGTWPIPPVLAEALMSVRLLFRMLAAAGALLLVHHAHAALTAAGRWRARIVALALAGLWGGDLIAFGITYAGPGSAAALAGVRGVIIVGVALVILLAGQQRDDRVIALSRTVAVQSLSAAALAGYAGLVALLSGVAAAVGGTQVRPIQTAIVIGATTALLTLLSTPWLRAWAKVKLAKHLFSHRYDYRVEWQRFTDTLGQAASRGDSAEPAADRPLRTRIVKALADLTDSPAGLLLVADGGRLGFGATWNWDVEMPAGGDEGLAQYLATTARIVELDEVRRGVADPAERASVPAWLVERADAWAIVPLAHGRGLTGVVVLARPPLDRALDWEDLDLLRLAAGQAASHLAEDRAHAALAEAERFDEFSRRFAFIIHDIKNLASQIALVARNAERHADNPDFRADMIATLKDSSDRMATLLARLAPQDGARPETLAPVDVAAVLDRIARARRAQHPVTVALSAGIPAALAHAGRLERVLDHLVQNAIEASDGGAPVRLSLSAAADAGVAIGIADSGCGMAPGFVRDQLFRPFASTKPQGFGIGAFEARRLVAAMGGTLDVASREGEGTCFTIRLPAAPALEVAA